MNDVYDYASLEETKGKLKHIYKNYDIDIRIKGYKASISLTRGRITTLLKLNGDKRASTIKSLDFLNSDRDRLYFACKEISLI